MAYIEKRFTKKNHPHFRALVRVKGFPAKSATFSLFSQAKDWANKIEAEMKAGRYKSDYSARKYTVANMIDRYCESVLYSKSTNERYINQQKQQLDWWRDKLKECKIINLTPYIINDLKEELAGRNFTKRKPATVNRYLAAITHVINTAIKEWGWMDENPIAKINKPKEPRGRARFLTDDERERLLKACADEKGKPLFVIVLMAISTGARKSEILRLKRKDVDLKRGVAVAYDTKNGDPRQLYLFDQLIILLSEIISQNKKAKYLFCNKSGNPISIEKEWKKALKAASIKDFRFHDLRHTAASYLAMNGASPSDIAEVLGHKSYDMVKRYTHHSKTHVAAVVSNMNNKVFGNQLKQKGV